MNLGFQKCLIERRSQLGLGAGAAAKRRQTALHLEEKHRQERQACRRPCVARPGIFKGRSSVCWLKICLNSAFYVFIFQIFLPVPNLRSASPRLFICICFITSFTPFEHSGRVTHATVQWWDTEIQKITEKSKNDRKEIRNICNFGHIQSDIEPFGKQVNNALKVYYFTKRRQNHQKLSFASLMPVFLLK